MQAESSQTIFWQSTDCSGPSQSTHRTTLMCSFAHARKAHSRAARCLGAGVDVGVVQLSIVNATAATRPIRPSWYPQGYANGAPHQACRSRSTCCGFTSEAHIVRRESRRTIPAPAFHFFGNFNAKKRNLYCLRIFSRPLVVNALKFISRSPIIEGEFLSDAARFLPQLQLLQFLKWGFRCDRS